MTQPPENAELAAATSLARYIWERHYAHETPDWEPLPDLLGVISQIDNMTAGLSRPDPFYPAKVGVREALEPFAAAAQRIDYYDGEHFDAPLYASPSGHMLTELLNGIDGESLRVSDLRRAREALALLPSEAPNHG